MSKGTPIKTGGKHKKNGVCVDGPWLAVPLELMASRLMASLSPLGLKLFVFFVAQLRANGGGNGRLGSHHDKLLEWGFTSKASSQAGIQELIDKGLLVRTKQGRKGSMAFYGLTPWHMDCKREGLELGPSAWSITEWRAVPNAVAPMSPQAPATWTRPRQAGRSTERTGAKRKRSPRGGGESPQCSPATGGNPAQTLPCSPATGAH